MIMSSDATRPAWSRSVHTLRQREDPAAGGSLAAPETTHEASPLSGFQIEISKWFTFEAAHRLNGLPEGHQCGRRHGHSYRVEVRLSAEGLTGPGFVTDFGALEPLAAYIRNRLDHRDLNEVLEVEPTSELLAMHLARWFMEHVESTIPGRLVAVAVTVSETARTSAVCMVRSRS